MAISIKTPDDIKNARGRPHGRRSAGNHRAARQTGVTTGELDRICHEYITNEQQAISACLGYHGFPKSVCISVNEVVCHGIPSDDKTLKDGDIVNIDVTVIKDGFHGDTSKMFIVGKPTILGERLCRVTQESLYLALKMVKPGIRLRTLGKAIQQFVEAEKFSVVREYCGTASAKCSTKSRRCCIMMPMTAAWYFRRAWPSPSNRWSTPVTTASAP